MYYGALKYLNGKGKCHSLQEYVERFRFLEQNFHKVFDKKENMEIINNVLNTWENNKVYLTRKNANEKNLEEERDIMNYALDGMTNLIFAMDLILHNNIKFQEKSKENN